MHSIAWWPSVIVLAVATITDLRSRRIPNWLVLPFLVAGIVVSGVSHGWHGIGQSLMGLALGGVLFGLLYWMGGMGMGDVKLLAAIGAWIGPGQLVVALGIDGHCRRRDGAYAGQSPGVLWGSYSAGQASCSSASVSVDCARIRNWF